MSLMCDFPLLRDRFWPPGPGDRDSPRVSSAPASPTKEGGASREMSRIGHLRTLDLRGLPHADGPPTELRAKKEKLAFFERQCTPIGEGLYLGAEHVARSRETLRDAGITHVVNCVGFLYPAYFEDELAYKTLHLQGAPRAAAACAARARGRRSPLREHGGLSGGLSAPLPQTRRARTSCVSCTTCLTS